MSGEFSSAEVELAERLERLKAMGQTIGRDFAMKIIIGKEPGWRYKFRPINTIEVDPEDVREKGLEYCLGIIAHEGAHRRVSRVDFIPKDLWQATGFSFLMNAVEDPRVNNWVGKKYEGAADWLRKVYDHDIPKKRIDEVLEKTLGYTPKHIRFGLEVIRHWHTGEFSEDVPEDIRVVLEKIIKDAEMAYKTIPSADPEDDEIVECAKTMFEIVRDRIWPEYQKLVEQAAENEALRQLIKQMMENGGLELPDEANGGSGEVGKGEPSSPESWPEELRKKIEEELRKKLAEMSPEEVKKAIAAAEAAAKKGMEDLNTAVTVELRGEFSDQPETVGEEKARLAAEAEVAEAEKHRAAEVAKIKAELEKKLEASRDAYQTAFEEVKPYVDILSDKLLEILVAKRFPQFRRSFPGQKLRLAGAMKFKSSRDYSELFERRLAAERPDFEFLLLVDLSGSMQGEKIKQTFKAVVLVVEAMNKAAEISGSIKIQVLGFQNTLIPFKDTDRALDDKLRKDMAAMPNFVFGPNGGFNNDGYCLDEASKSLRASPVKDKLLIVLSDGKPCGDKIHRVSEFQELDENEELRQVIRRISLAGDLGLLALGLGPGTEHVKNFYDSRLPNVENIPSLSLDRLVEVLSEKIVKLIS